MMLTVRTAIAAVGAFAGGVACMTLGLLGMVIAEALDLLDPFGVAALYVIASAPLGAAVGAIVGFVLPTREGSSWRIRLLDMSADRHAQHRKNRRAARSRQIEER